MITLLSALFLLSTTSLWANSDPCIGLVGMVNAPRAAVLSAKREGQVKPEEFRELRRAEKGEPAIKNNDAQFKARWTSYGKQQNGRHERMHRTLKAEATIPPKQNILQQQETFDVFKQTFNFEHLTFATEQDQFNFGVVSYLTESGFP